MKHQDHEIHIPDAAEVAEFGGPSERNKADRSNAVSPDDGDAPTQVLSGSVDELARQAEDWKDKCLRAKAELQNVQRRHAQERSDLIRYAHADFARALLSVLTDVERTIDAAEKAAAAGPVLDGVRLIRDDFLKVLGQFGIEPIAALHTPFDPTRHEALMQQPSEEFAPGTVVQEFERGYKLHDRVLRPARVVVAAERQSESK